MMVGETALVAMILIIATLGWEHIGLTGGYVWGAAPLLETDLRPLRRKQSLLAA